MIRHARAALAFFIAGVGAGAGVPGGIAARAGHGLFPHDFNHQALGALAVELGVENLLPGA